MALEAGERAGGEEHTEQEAEAHRLRGIPAGCTACHEHARRQALLGAGRAHRRVQSVILGTKAVISDSNV